jgi:hypothetical protein
LSRSLEIASAPDLQAGYDNCVELGSLSGPLGGRHMAERAKYPELLSNIGKAVDLKFPDGSTMQWQVMDEIRKEEDAEKIFVLQRLCRKGGGNQEMFRFGYYIIGKKPKMKDRWTWGQYAPFVTAADFSAIIKEAQNRKWIR